ncbi:MAG TPA: decaprenyl-phosphate phosphoribosyltransferase [Alphaproteobacteria bacterium]|nr:decaprenyl-phosphate phosphoribosyltransferase [Alphaproteobacteria bacterium]
MSPSAMLRLARPRQWIKNAFVAAPLFFTPAAISAGSLLRTALAVAIFCLLSSTAYAINDWFDRDADRLHPEKRTRPIAAGEVSGGEAAALVAVLLFVVFALGLTLLPGEFSLVAFGYFALNLFYSLKLKNMAILDVLTIAVGFVLRIDAGALVIGVRPSVWIVVCAFLLALFLALAKRRDDLVRTLDADHRASLAGYNRRFIETGLAMVLGSLLVSYVIYTTDAAVIARYGTEKLYLTVPFVAAGILRYLQITLVEERSGSPTDIMFSDRFIAVAVLGWVVTFAALIYG